MIPLKTLLSAVCLLLFASLATADESTSYKKLLTPLLESGETIIGQPIAYPTGTPKITAAVVFLAPGKETGWHTHAVPLYAYVLQGELTMEVEHHVFVARVGQHQAHNNSTHDLRIMVTSQPPSHGDRVGVC